MSGLAMYITALVVCLILDAMFSRDWFGLPINLAYGGI
jgi:hypothetical protein